MSGIRLIARLDIKGQHLIKGIHLEGLRKIGDPQEFARRYYDSGVDEILYMDVVASLYQRENLLKIVRQTARDVFIPLTVGGGIRSIDDATNLLRAGADKVALNTAAVKRPGLICELAYRFGSQCIVLSVEAKRKDSGGWEVYTDSGRERTGLDVLEWVNRAVELGAGEVLLTSVDQEGTANGFDVELVRAVSAIATVPVIASGGMGRIEHLLDVVNEGKADAVGMARVLHYNTLSIRTIRQAATVNGITVRLV
jgi:imidazole glycerol-phosphate synthase subunit HisF